MDASGSCRAEAILYGMVASPLIMEAFAARDGIRLDGDLGLCQVILEMDCLRVVKLWNTKEFQRSEIATFSLGDFRDE